MITPFSVPAIWMPTRFRDIGTETGTRCNLAGCENHRASELALEAIANPSPDLVIDHWDSQDRTLREALARRHGVRAEQILLTSGATGGIRYAFEVFAGPDTRIGLLSPDWPGFRFYAERARGSVSRLHSPGFPYAFTPVEVAAFVRDRAVDFLILANPSAVTGRLWEAGEVAELLTACPDTLFVIDEADAVHPELSAAALVDTHRNVLFIGSFSKFYGLSGLRIGYLVTPREHADHLARTISPAEVTSLALVAARAALADREYQRRTRQDVARNLDVLEKAVAGTPVRLVPGSRCFAAYLDTDAAAPDLTELLAGHGVDIVPGSGFGLATGGRVNLSNPELVDRLVAVLPQVSKALTTDGVRPTSTGPAPVSG
ncbi:aminotransferase class I/II-fold pyridoxal phosphate-dependent enzyme [Embleya sp. NPDC020630]|uniref:aminotransferase class I/II-fold pyridoxal phosphate-dependent enzyme n=1 Tax=Embleya sp. NPDC020630 TaxID=3363979 RepID=UPI0037918D2E